MFPKQSNLQFHASPVYPDSLHDHNDHNWSVNSDLRSPMQQKSPRWRQEGILELPEQSRVGSKVESPVKAAYTKCVGSPVRTQSFDEFSADSAYNSGYNSIYGSTLGSTYGSIGSGLGSTMSIAFGSTGSGLGSSYDIDSMASPGAFKSYDQIHKKFPSWPVAPLNARQPEDRQLGANRSTSWSDAAENPKNIMHRSTMSFPTGVGHPSGFSGGDQFCDGWCGRRTHREETVSPESAKRIFREAVKRNERQRSDRNSGSWMHESPLKPQKVLIPSSPLKSANAAKVSSSCKISDELPVRSSKSLPRELKILSQLNSSDNASFTADHSRCSQSVDASTSNNFGYNAVPGTSAFKQNVAPEGTGLQDNYSSHAHAHLSLLEKMRGMNMKHGQINDGNGTKQPICGPFQMPAASNSPLKSLTPERPNYLPGVSPRSVKVAESTRGVLKDQVLRSLSSPGVNFHLTVVADQGSSEIDGDLRSGLPLKDTSKKISNLPLSHTSVLRKLSQEFYGQSAKHNSGEANSKVMESKAFQGHVFAEDVSTGIGDESSSAHRRSGCMFSEVHVDGSDRNVNGRDSSGVRPSVLNVTSPKIISGKGNPSFQAGPSSSETLFHQRKLFQEQHPGECNHLADEKETISESPSPPELPPRKYQSESLGEKPIGVIAPEKQSVKSTDFDGDFDSPLVADIYADQLRRQAKRYSHSNALNHTPRSHPTMTSQVSNLETGDLSLSNIATCLASSSSETAKTVMQSDVKSPNDPDFCAEVFRGNEAIGSNYDRMHSTEKDFRVISSNTMLENDVGGSTTGVGKCVKGTEKALTSCSSSVVTMREVLYAGDNNVNFVYVPAVENAVERKEDPLDGHSTSDENKGKKDLRVKELSSSLPENILKAVNLKFLSNRIDKSEVTCDDRNQKDVRSFGNDRQIVGKNETTLNIRVRERSAGVKNMGVPKERSVSCHERSKLNNGVKKSDGSLNRSAEGLNNASNHLHEEFLSKASKVIGNRKESSDHRRKDSDDEKRSYLSKKNTLNNQDENLQNSGTRLEIKGLENGKFVSSRGEKVLSTENDKQQNKLAQTNSNQSAGIDTNILKTEKAAINPGEELENKSTTISGHKSRCHGFKSLVSDSDGKETNKTVKEKAKNYVSVFENGEKSTNRNFERYLKPKIASKPECNLKNEIAEMPRVSPKPRRSILQKFSLPSDKMKQKFDGVGSEKELVTKENVALQKYKQVNGHDVELNSNGFEHRLLVCSSKPKPSSPRPQKRLEMKLIKSKFVDSGFSIGSKTKSDISSATDAENRTHNNTISGSVFTLTISPRPRLAKQNLEVNGEAVSANESSLSDQTGSKEAALDRAEDDALNAGFVGKIMGGSAKTLTQYLVEFLIDGNEDSSVMAKDRMTCSLLKVRGLLKPFLRHLTRNLQKRSNEETHEEEDLCDKFEEKLLEFQKERLLIDKEIADCTILGQQVTSLAQEKLGEKEFEKYTLHLDELEKILCLLLNLTKRLFCVESSISALPKDGGGSEEKAVLISKLSDLTQKYEDAKALSEGIAHRHRLVADYLKTSLAEKDFGDFEQFLELKLRLFLEKHALDDIVLLIRERLKTNSGCVE